MKKKLIALFAAALVVFSLTLPSVQAAAVSALSVFRVTQARTVQITYADFTEFFAALQLAQPALGAMDMDVLPFSVLSPDSATPRLINSLDEFTAFDVRLPAALADETPELYAVDSASASFALNAQAINGYISALGGQTLIDEALDGQTLTIISPPALTAEYESVLLLAMQAPRIDGSRDARAALYSALINLPLVPENVRAQLAQIDVDTRDIYLPEIMGFGRPVRIGGEDGFVYSMYDLESMISRFTGNEKAPLHSTPDATVVIWTHDGVLYCMASDISEFELCSIAVSVK